MSRYNNTGKLQLLGFVLLSLVAGVLLATSSCSTTNVSISSIELFSNITPVIKSDSLDPISSNTINSNSITSIASSEEQSEPLEEIDPTLPLEVKQREYTLNPVSKENIQSLFTRIFNEAPTISDLGFTYFSDDILKQVTTANDEVVELYKNGLIKLSKNNEVLYTLELSEVFTNYINDPTATLVGANYKYDFGIVKKNNLYYFQFLGLNLPLENEPINYLEIIVNTIAPIQGTFNNSTALNTIPLLFYKHFANICIENKLTKSAEDLFNKAIIDATSGREVKFDTNILDGTSTIDNILYLLSKSRVFISGDSSNSLTNTAAYCFSSMFKESNPDFVSTKDIYFNEDILIVDNGSKYEGLYYADYYTSANYFPLCNFFELYEGEKDEQDYALDGKHYFVDEIGKIAIPGMISFSKAEFYADDLSHETNISDYFFNWTLTDAYYYILDFYTTKGYFTSAKYLYASTFQANLLA